MDYEILDNITSADIAVAVTGENLNELFMKGGMALVSEMTDDPGKIIEKEIRSGTLRHEELDLLFFGFLNEILFYKDAEGVILKPINVEIESSGGEYTCTYIFAGELINESLCGFRVDIKGVSLHHLKIEENGGFFKGVAVFDA